MLFVEADSGVMIKELGEAEATAEGFVGVTCSFQKENTF
jgi:hypothetical protein